MTTKILVLTDALGNRVESRYDAHGNLVRKDSFTSHYVAVGDTVIYGPGTDPPRIDFVLPSI